MLLKYRVYSTFAPKILLVTAMAAMVDKMNKLHIQLVVVFEYSINCIIPGHLKSH